MGIHIRTLLSWLGLSAILGVILGYIIGFKVAQPVLEDLVGPLGLITFGIAVLVLMFLVLRQWWLRDRLMALLGSLWRSLRLVVGNLRKTLVGVFCVTVAGGLLGGILGYVVGLQTAQPIFDMAATLGMIVLGIILLAVVVVIIVAVLMGAGSSGSPQRRSGRRYRGRRR